MEYGFFMITEEFIKRHALFNLLAKK